MSAGEIIAGLGDNCALPFRVLAGEATDPAVKAWNGRVGALAAVEMRGSFFDAEKNCPKIGDLFDGYEEAFRKVQAETTQGVLAKLWVALSHLGPSPADYGNRGDDAGAANCRAEHDAVRRGDTDEVASFIERWDFGEEVLFGAIRDLERMMREAQ